MKKIICGFFICWLASVFSAFSQTYETLSEQALVAAEQDSLELAEKYITEALKLSPADPRNALLFSNLGTIQRRQQRYEMALESYTYALNIAPLEVPILLNRAALYLELGRSEQARVDYSLVLDQDKGNQEALSMRAYIYMQERNYKAARIDYDTLLKLNRQNYSACLGYATLEQREGHYGKALSLLNEMLTGKSGEEQMSPSFRATLYVARAGVEQDMQHTDLALVDLEEAIRLDASLSDAYLMRGKLYLTQKKKGLAKSDFEKAISLGIPRAEMRKLLQQCK